MDMAVEAGVIKQHLIDPEICIRCNTCEATCPVGAITHDSRNYVVDAAKCNLCMACVPPCPTGSIDNWRTVPRVRVIEMAPIMFLLFICVAQTVWAGPVIRFTQAAAESLHAPAGYVSDVLQTGAEASQQVEGK